MKVISQGVLILISLSFVFAGCPKEIPPNPNEYVFTINAKLSDTSETINLGDTLTLEVQFPDTVTAKNYLNQVRTEKVDVLQKAAFSYSLFFADTVARIDHYLTFSKPEYNVSQYFKIYLSAGTTQYEPYTPFMQTIARPYNAVLHMIPKVRGIFYLQIGANTSFQINQNFSGKFIVHLPSTNHIHIVNRNIDSYYWLQSVEINRTKGRETYAFRVK